jgi:hypothetical protein
VIQKLLQLQDKIYNYYIEMDKEYEQKFDPLYCPKIYFCKTGEFYDITFYGEGWDDYPQISVDEMENWDSNYAFYLFLEFLAKNASNIKSLKFEGWDEGANGIKVWDFTRLVNSNAVFENLEEFKVELTDPAAHNMIALGSDFDEEGQIAKLVAKMPNLKILQTPSAPNEDFFKLKDLKVTNLIVQASYSTNGFIKNLANSDNLKQVYSLDYTNVFALCDDSGRGTTYDEYELLFKSNFFANSPRFHFKLRDTRLSKEQLLGLKKIKNIQLLYVDTDNGYYIPMERNH